MPNLTELIITHGEELEVIRINEGGYSGFSGYSGVGGGGGVSGYSGFCGLSGRSGYSGYSGSGLSGYSGFSGRSGYSGFSGFSGLSGRSGYSGYSATSGASGYSGYSGYSGPASAPINQQDADYVFALGDAAKTIYHTDATPRAYTIPDNGSVPFPTGTLISIVNGTGAADITLGITSDTLQRGDGTAGTGSRTISADSVVTLIKVESTVWYITGVFT